MIFRPERTFRPEHNYYPGLFIRMLDEIAPSIKDLYNQEFLGDVYIDMDGVLTPYADYENDNWLNHPEILCKKPQLTIIPNDWIILTKFSTPKEAILKYAWAKEYFPKNKIILVPAHESKADFIHPQSYDILIDDYNKNLNEWIAAGGCAIKFLNGINSMRADVPCVTLKEVIIWNHLIYTVS